MDELKKVFTEIAEASPAEGRRFEQHVAPVKESDDLTRILALPRRLPPDEATQKAMADEMTVRLRRDNPRCRCALLRPEVVRDGGNPCITSLRPLQGWYLYEASQLGGAIGFMPVGSGKTGVDILVAMVVPGCRLAVLMLRPNEVEQLLSDYDIWSQHFKVPNLVAGNHACIPGRPSLELFPYSMISQQSRANYFAERKPDVLIGDEAQCLKDRKAARTGRFLRHFKSMPGTKFFAHSGSMTTRKLEDFAHLMALSLREGSPLPLYPSVVEAWGQVVNPNQTGAPADPGQLMRLVGEGETLEQALNRRIVETMGVISTSDISTNARLEFHEADAGEVPESVREALRSIRTKEQRPDGEELLDQLEVAAVSMQVACGFYYRWKFPRGEPEELIEEWFLRRQSWNREMRERLKRRQDGLDSPGLLRNAAERAWGIGKFAGSEGPKWKAGTFRAWAEIEKRVQPEPDVVWIDDFLARAAAKWATENVGIVWYMFSAFGRKVEQLTKLPRFGGGDEASRGIKEENRTRGDRSIIASLKAHGTGKNLQSWSRQLWANVPADGGAWEQGIGRCHRYGQARDVVEVHVYRHLPEFMEAWSKATDYARYIQGLSGNPQKLLYGVKRWTR
jgi:hypothetical protein